MKLLPLICVSALAVTAGALLGQSPPYVSVTSGSKVSLQCDTTDVSGRCSEVVWLHVGQLSVSVSRPYVPGAQNKTLCQLEISRATLQDAGRYYCVYINGLMLMTGGGTTLTVTEPALHGPAVDLLVPSDVRADASLPVPLICLVSGLEDTGRVIVDWEVNFKGEGYWVDGVQQLIVAHSEAGVISKQLYVPAETWSAGVDVSCVVTDGEQRIRTSASSRAGKSSQCVVLSSIIGAACVVLFTVTVTLSILLSCRQRRHGPTAGGRPRTDEEASADLHYAALRFNPPASRSIS